MNRIGRYLQSPYTKTFLIALVIVMAFNVFQLFQGFTDYDESFITLQFFKFFKNMAQDRTIEGFVWPDSGMNGPMKFWFYAPFMFVFSYLLRIPIDITVRLIPWLLIPFSSFFLFESLKKVFREPVALILILAFLSSPFFTMFNTLIVGEELHTLAFTLSLWFLTRKRMRRNMYLSLMVMAFGLMVKFTFAPLLIFHLLYVLAYRNEIKPRTYDYVFGGIIIASGFFPLLLMILLNGSAFLGRFYQVQRHAVEGIGTLLGTVARLLFRGLAPVLMFTMIAGSVVASAGLNRKNLRKYVVWAGGSFVVIIFFIAINSPSIRYLYTLVFPALFLTGLMLESLPQVIVERKLMLSFILALVFIPSMTISATKQIFSCYFGEDINWIYDGKSVWKQAALYALEHTEPGDMIATYPPASIYVFGKRIMVDNLKIDTAVINSDSTVSYTFRMRGERVLTAGPELKYLVGKHNRVPVSGNASAIWKLERSYGPVAVFRNTLAGDPVLSSTEVDFRYDLKSIVEGFFSDGLMLPVDEEEYISGN